MASGTKGRDHLGLKELPEDGTTLVRMHNKLGHAFKGQINCQIRLCRFNEGGGTFLDLENLVHETGRRIAAFGYWVGYLWAAETLRTRCAQHRREVCGPVDTYSDKDAMLSDLEAEFSTTQKEKPIALVICALGLRGKRSLSGAEVGRHQMGLGGDAAGGPFPRILQHDHFFNCILARSVCRCLFLHRR